MEETNSETVNSRWKWVYKISSATALVTGVLFFIGGIDLIIIGLQLGANGWLSSFGNIWLPLLIKIHVGISGVQLNQLYALNLLDTVILVLIAITFLGLYAALRKASKIWSLIALILPFLGFLIFIATKLAGRSAVILAVLIMSFCMLRSNIFSNSAAFIGILTGILLLTGDISLSIAKSGIIAILVGIGYILLIVWFLVVSRRLFHLDKKS